MHNRVITFTEQCVIKVKTSAIFLKSKCDPTNIHILMQSTIRLRFIVCCILICPPPAVFVFSNIPHHCWKYQHVDNDYYPPHHNHHHYQEDDLHHHHDNHHHHPNLFILISPPHGVCVCLPRLLDENWCHSVNKVYCIFQKCCFNF